VTLGTGPRLIAFAAALVVGCGGAQRTLAPNEVGVGIITVVGANEVDPGDLKSGLGVTRAKELNHPYARYLLGLDRRRIQGYYLRHGFFRATVTSKATPRGKLTDVEYTIVEGPRARMTAVDIVGMPPDVPEAELRGKILLADGDPFDYTSYELARPTLVAVLEENGYAHAKVTPTVIANKDHDTAVIRIEIDPGPRAVFGKVEVTGVKGPLARTVKNRLHIKDGDPYSLHAIADSRADLYELGRFSIVQLETDKAGREPIVPVEVKIGEKPRNELRAGGGVGYSPISYEVRGRTSYGIAGWPTPLMNSRFEVRPAVVRLKDEAGFQPRIEAVASFERLDLFRPRLIGTVEGSFSYLTLEAYTSYGPRVHTALRSPLYRRIVSASLGWGLQELRFRELDIALSMDDVTRYGLDQPERVGAFDQALIVDLRDSPLVPTRGAYGEVRIEEGTKAAGGAFSYFKIAPDLRGYFSLGSTTFAARVGFAMISGEVPVTKRLFSGGASTQRGFGERRLAPEVIGMDENGEERRVPIGGAAMFSTSFELRRHLATVGTDVRVGTVLFVDGADVAEKVGDIELGNLHWAMGTGLRINYFVPFRLDVGYRLNRIGPMDPDPATSTWGRMAIHLSVGEAF
jgi:translocation and assembly module TamA